MSVNNSYFDAIADLSVEDVLSSSELILAASQELLAGTQAYDLLFNPCLLYTSPSPRDS